MTSANQSKLYKIVWVVFFIVSAYLIWTVSKFNNDLAFSDQIDIFYGYLTKQDLLTLFLQQHGPHRQGVGAILMLPALWLANWNFSVISYITCLIMILSAYVLILTLRVYQTNPITAIACVLLILSLGAAELLTVTPNISHSTLPILFSLIILWLNAKSPITSTATGIAILTLAIGALFTGFGIFVFLSYLTVFFLKQQFLIREVQHDLNQPSSKIIFSKISIGTYFVIGVSIMIFFINYQSSAATAEGCTTTAIDNFFNVLKYSFSVASIILGGSQFPTISRAFGFFIVLSFILLSIFCLVRVIKNKDKMAMNCLFLILISIGFIFNVAIGRHCLGADSAFASRYYPLSSLGLIGVLVALDHFCRNSYPWFPKILSAVVIALTLAVVFPLGLKLMNQYHEHKNNFIVCMLNNESVKFCNDLFKIYPDSDRLESFYELVLPFKSGQHQM
jgi:hypothetical protein